MFGVAEEPAMRTCEPGGEKRVGTKKWKRQTTLMNMKRTQSHCLNVSFQRRWSAGRARARRLGLAEERL